MKKHKREFLDFEKSFNEINLVINEPNYVGLYPDGQSIQFIKVTNENILLAVKLDKALNARIMYVIKDNKLQNYLNSGRIKKFKYNIFTKNIEDRTGSYRTLVV